MGPAVWAFDVLSGVRACGGLGNGGVCHLMVWEISFVYKEAAHFIKEV